MNTPPIAVEGLLLAAGAGTRMGRPKALVAGWLPESVATLFDGGCSSVTVVLGAAADDARPLVPAAASVVVADDWESGMSASLRAGLGSLDPTTTGAAVVHLVDLPDVGPDVVARFVAAAGPNALARAMYHRTPGHPVLLGRDHWASVMESASGDRGAREYLRTRQAVEIECGDLATGRDVDR